MELTTVAEVKRQPVVMRRIERGVSFNPFPRDPGGHKAVTRPYINQDTKKKVGVEAVFLLGYPEGDKEIAMSVAPAKVKEAYMLFAETEKDGTTLQDTKDTDRGSSLHPTLLIQTEAENLIVHVRYKATNGLYDRQYEGKAGDVQKGANGEGAYTPVRQVIKGRDELPFEALDAGGDPNFWSQIEVFVEERHAGQITS